MSELFRNIGGVDVQTAHDNGRNAIFSFADHLIISQEDTIIGF